MGGDNGGLKYARAYLSLKLLFYILSVLKQNDGLGFFMDGSNILRTRLYYGSKHLISLGKVVYVCIYEVTRDQAVGLI